MNALRESLEGIWFIEIMNSKSDYDLFGGRIYLVDNQPERLLLAAGQVDQCYQSSAMELQMANG